MKEARDHNTICSWSDTIWRVFLEGKLFVSDDGQTCFDSENSAMDAVLKSTWMKTVNEYVDYVEKFFGYEGLFDWRREFLAQIFKNMNLKFRKYEYRGEPDNS